MQLKPGQIVAGGKYRVERPLGRGRFGEVYLVTHLALNVPRGLKVLAADEPGLAPADYARCRDRFRQEAQLGAQLNTPTPHPHLLQVHDQCEADGRLLLEMEYAPGGDLAARIEQLRAHGELMAIPEAVRIAAEVAGGLAALHRAGVVHRDLKPGNILFDAQGRAKVADLGLAQAVSGGSLASSAGVAFVQPGTPAYMSPEQAGNALLLRPSSDIYSLGVVLFEMLTGRLYYSLPPGTPPSQLRLDVPPWLDQLAGKLLSPDLFHRPWDGDAAEQLLRTGPPAPEQPAQPPTAQPVAPRLPVEPPATQPAPEWGGPRVPAEAQTRRLAPFQPPPPEPQQPFTPAPIQRASPQQLAALALGLVRIPAGPFIYGEDRPRLGTRRERIDLPEFRISRTTITNEQYSLFAQDTGYRGGPDWVRQVGSRPPAIVARHPVVNVTWWDATAFCRWAGVRLPTQQEWEKAARGEAGEVYPWGDSWVANNCHSAEDQVRGVIPATPPRLHAGEYGLSQMAGNVWEWCADGPDDARRYLRGGSFYFSRHAMACAVRFCHFADAASFDWGFRVAA